MLNGRVARKAVTPALDTFLTPLLLSVARVVINLRAAHRNKEMI